MMLVVIVLLIQWGWWKGWKERISIPNNNCNIVVIVARSAKMINHSGIIESNQIGRWWCFCTVHRHWRWCEIMEGRWKWIEKTLECVCCGIVGFAHKIDILLVHFVSECVCCDLIWGGVCPRLWRWDYPKDFIQIAWANSLRSENFLIRKESFQHFHISICKILSTHSMFSIYFCFSSISKFLRIRQSSFFGETMRNQNVDGITWGISVGILTRWRSLFFQSKPFSLLIPLPFDFRFSLPQREEKWGVWAKYNFPNW